VVTLNFKDEKINECYNKARRKWMFKFLVAVQLLQTVTITNLLINYAIDGVLEEWIFLIGSVVCYPVFLMPIIFGQRFPWLFDWCGPVNYLLRMLTIVIQINHDAEELKNDPGSTFMMYEFFIRKQSALAGFAVLYLYTDLFLITENFYSRIFNFFVYCSSVAALMTIETIE